MAFTLSEFAKNDFSKKIKRKIMTKIKEKNNSSILTEEERKINLQEDLECSYSDYLEEEIYRRSEKIINKRSYKELQVGMYLQSKQSKAYYLNNECTTRLLKSRKVVENFIMYAGKRTKLEVSLRKIGLNTNCEDCLAKSEENWQILNETIKTMNENCKNLPDKIKYYIGEWAIRAAAKLKKSFISISRYKYYSSAPVYFDSYKYLLQYCKILELECNKYNAELILTSKEFTTIFENIQLYSEYNDYIVNFDKLVMKSFIETMSSLNILDNSIINYLIVMGYSTKEQINALIHKNKCRTVEQLSLLIIKEYFALLMNHLFNDFNDIFLENTGTYSVTSFLKKISENNSLKKKEDSYKF